MTGHLIAAIQVDIERDQDLAVVQAGEITAHHGTESLALDTHQAGAHFGEGVIGVALVAVEAPLDFEEATQVRVDLAGAVDVQARVDIAELGAGAVGSSSISVGHTNGHTTADVQLGAVLVVNGGGLYGGAGEGHGAGNGSR